MMHFLVGTQQYLPLVGCFKKVFINGRMFDFTTVTAQFKVMPGCSDPCERNDCVNGKCIVIDSVRYKCECKQGYSGKACDIGEMVQMYKVIVI